MVTVSRLRAWRLPASREAREVTTPGRGAADIDTTKAWVAHGAGLIGGVGDGRAGNAGDFMVIGHIGNLLDLNALESGHSHFPQVH